MWFRTQPMKTFPAQEKYHWVGICKCGLMHHLPVEAILRIFIWTINLHSFGKYIIDVFAWLAICRNSSVSRHLSFWAKVNSKYASTRNIAPHIVLFLGFVDYNCTCAFVCQKSGNFLSWPKLWEPGLWQWDRRDDDASRGIFVAIRSRRDNCLLGLTNGGNSEKGPSLSCEPHC